MDILSAIDPIFGLPAILAVILYGIAGGIVLFLVFVTIAVVLTMIVGLLELVLRGLGL